MKKYGKKIITQYEKYFYNELYKIVVLKNKDYYNVHIINDKFRDDEANTLHLQEPAEAIPNHEKYFDKKYLIARLMEFYIWDKFYDEGIVSTNVEIEEIEPHQ